MTDVNEKVQKIVKLFNQGKTFVQLQDGPYGEERYAFPHGAEWDTTINTTKKEAEYLSKFFDNCTILSYAKHLEVFGLLICPNSKIPQRQYDWESTLKDQSLLIDGAVYGKEKICEECVHFLKRMVGECTKDEVKPSKNYQERLFVKKEMFDDLHELKRGYVKEYEFARSITFTASNIEEQIRYYAGKGQDAKKRNTIRRHTCIGEKCIKYHTESCPKGWREHRKTADCLLNMEMAKNPLLQLMEQDFGSPAKAYWYFSQCNRYIDYKDPNTKRTSERLIAVPAARDGGTKAEGFFMAKPRYPYAIGDYHRVIKPRYYRGGGTEKNTRISKHEAFLPKKEYEEKYAGMVNRRAYDKKEHEDVLLAIYALYRICRITPGRSRYLYRTISEYDVSLGIDGTAGKYRYGNSTGSMSASIDSLHELADYIEIFSDDIKKEMKKQEVCNEK